MQTIIIVTWESIPFMNEIFNIKMMALPLCHQRLIAANLKKTETMLSIILICMDRLVKRLNVYSAICKKCWLGYMEDIAMLAGRWFKTFTWYGVIRIEMSLMPFSPHKHKTQYIIYQAVTDRMWQMVQQNQRKNSYIPCY